MKVIRKGLVLLLACFFVTSVLAAQPSEASSKNKAHTMQVKTAKAKPKKYSRCKYVKKCSKMKKGKKSCKKVKVCKKKMKKYKSHSSKSKNK